jgi:hypothetical protein
MLCLCFLTFFTHRFQQQGGGGAKLRRGVEKVWNRDPGWKKIGSGIIIFILLFAKKKLIVFMFRRLERLMEKMTPEEVAEHPGLGPVCVVSFLAFFSGSAFV